MQSSKPIKKGQVEDYISNSTQDALNLKADIGSETTNLSYTPSPTNGVVVNDKGTDANIPLADVTNAGLLSPADKANLDNQSGINSGNQTSIVGISGTKAEFNTELTDGDFLFVGDVVGYTNEEAQDAVGTILTDTATIDFTYDDTIPTISANVKLNSIDATHLSDSINNSEFINDSNYITLAEVPAFDPLNYDLDDFTNVSADPFARTSELTNGITNLQQAYNNSITPEITTDSTLGAFTLKRGSAVDTDNIFEGQNGAGVNTSSIAGNGALTALTYNGFNPTTDLRNINTTPPLLGGGNLTVDRTLSIQQATTSQSGFLTSTDWNVFNNKVSNATHTGDATGATALTLATVNSNVGSFGTASNVPQYTVNAKGLITASANIPIQIAESQVINLVTDLSNKQATLVSGTNIRTINGNSLLGSTDLTIPVATDATTLAKGIVQLAGDLAGTSALPTVPGLGLKANLAGTQTFTGIHNFPTATAGTNTTQVATTAFVLANGASNAVLLTGDQTKAGTLTMNASNARLNLNSNANSRLFESKVSGLGVFPPYFETSNNTAAIQINNASTGSLNIVSQNNGVNTYTVDKLGVTTATSFINSTAPATNALLANGTTLANPISGTGTTGYLPKFTSAGVVGDSQVFDNGTNVGIGTNNPLAKAHIYGGGVTTNIATAISNATLRIDVANPVTGLVVGYTNDNSLDGVFVQAVNNSNNTPKPLPLNPYGGSVGIGVVKPTEKLDVNGSVIATGYKISALNTAPTSATATGTTGEIRITAGFIYVCTATNTWVRTALATW